MEKIDILDPIIMYPILMAIPTLIACVFAYIAWHEIRQKKQRKSSNLKQIWNCL